MQVILTRAKEDCREIADKLTKLGIDWVCLPCIEYKAPSDNYQALDKAIRANHEYDWLFFLSCRAAESFFTRLLEIGGQLFHLSPHLKIACVGKATANFISKEINFPVDFIPSQFNSETMFQEFKLKHSGRILLVREESLINEPIDVDLDVTVVAGYKSQTPSSIQAPITKASLITITSSQIARNFHLLNGTLVAATFLSIGPQTTTTLKELYPEAEVIQAKEASVESLLDEIMLKYKHGREKNQQI